MMIQRALLADRDPASRDRLSQHLQALGLDVTAVSTSEELIEQLLTTAIELVFIDLNLAGTEDGTEDGIKASIDTISATAHLIRGSGQTASTIVVATPLSTSDQARLTAQDVHLLCKPIDPTALKRLLEHDLQGPTPETASGEHAALDGNELSLLRLEFIETLNSHYLDDLKAALEQHSARATRAVLHKLKGSAGSFGYHRLGRLAASAESLLRQGHALDEVVAQVDVVLAEAERLQQSTNRGPLNALVM
jgi:CheY-like chemotaxis protein